MPALTNAAKHSGASEVLVTVRGLPHLSFSVSVNGVGRGTTLRGELPPPDTRTMDTRG